jgi:hypothetical protein
MHLEVTHLWEHKLTVCGTGGNLPSPQAVKIPKASSNSEYTKREVSIVKAAQSGKLILLQKTSGSLP